MSFAVVETAGDGLARRLEALTGVPAGRSPAPDVLVVAPGAEGAAWPGMLRCGTVLLPGSASALLSRVKAAGAVSYGTSGRDSVALASRDGDRLAVSLQRELVRPDGTVVERQEIVTRVAAALDSQRALALVGALLLLGAGAGELERLYLA